MFVPEHQHLDASQEKAIYNLHQNHDADPGYRRFLSRLIAPLLPLLAPGCRGLDFGCGPGPVLADMLRQAGHDMALYDPFYADFPKNLHKQYAFITCSEVVEHFRRPAAEFARLFSLLSLDGHLAIMTKRLLNAEAFSRWHYKQDQTHIAFYSEASLQWLAEHYQCQIVFVGRDVLIFKKPATTGQCLSPCQP
ncbi:MAG: class I SAM-dependent methyltransferase [Methylococcales bacterium]|nr:class I SAM-dependent methyltransferase [Methylococcales bacterium]